MRCEDIQLDAYADRELDPARSSEFEHHLAACPSCRARLAELSAMRTAIDTAGLRRRAPQSLRDAITAAIDREDRPAARPRRAPAWAWGSLAACLILTAAVVTLSLGSLSRRATLTADAREAISAHIRSLMGAHLLDIPTSDQHTVKPWFAGKLDFSPPVADLSTQGFPLAGGRLDYLAGHPAAALVYNRRAHIINLFIAPDPSGTAAPHLFEDRGYHAAAWSDGHMRFCAVSDVNQDELTTFTQLLRSRAERPPPSDGR